jgi:hypothetical protein
VRRVDLGFAHAHSGTLAFPTYFISFTPLNSSSRNKDISADGGGFRGSSGAATAVGGGGAYAKCLIFTGKKIA